MLVGLLAVVAFQSRKMPTVNWIRGKIVIILSYEAVCALYKAYMYYSYISKRCIEQCLKALVFVMRMELIKFTCKQIREQLY